MLAEKRLKVCKQDVDIEARIIPGEGSTALCQGMQSTRVRDAFYT